MPREIEHHPELEERRDSSLHEVAQDRPLAVDDLEADPRRDQQVAAKREAIQEIRGGRTIIEQEPNQAWRDVAMEIRRAVLEIAEVKA